MLQLKKLPVSTVLSVSLMISPSIYAAIHAESTASLHQLAGKPPVLIAGGYKVDLSSGDRSPLVVTSGGDGGVNWQLANVCADGEDARIAAADCTGSGSRSICVAAGVDHNQSAEVLYVSRDGGTSWARKYATAWPSSGGYYNSTSCTGRGKSARCVVVGMTASNDHAPLMSVSTDGGLTWATKDLSFLPYPLGFLDAVDCVGKGASAICVGVGRVRDDQGNRALAVAASHDGGENWMYPSSVPVTRNELKAVSCIPNGSSAACVAVGGGEEGSLLMNSFDGGTTWTQRSGPPTFPTSLNDVSCTGRASKGVCVTVGSNYVFSSMDSGSTLTQQTVPGLPVAIQFQHVSCTGSGAQATCALIGRDHTNGQSFLAVTQYGPANWSLKTISGAPATIELESVHCEGNKATATCTVAGLDQAGNSPFLAQSTNGGMDWHVVSVVNMPAQGALVAAGANKLKSMNRAS